MMPPLAHINRQIDLAKRRSGFTLVELLVVVATIAILAALLMPAVSTAKFHGKNTACKNNLRQFGLALQIYLNTYGAYPPRWANIDLNLGVYFDWDQLLEKEMQPGPEIVPYRYLPTPDVLYTRSRVHASFTCPIIAPFWPYDKKRTMYPTAPRYGYNTCGIADWGDEPSYVGLAARPAGPEIGSIEGGQRESNVVAPSDMIAFRDPFARSLNADRESLQTIGQWRPTPNIPPRGTPFPQQSKASADSHRHKFNRVFCDGHVESENFNRPFVDSDTFLRRWNVDNQPHREIWNSYH